MRTSCAPTIGSPWLPRIRLVRLDADLDPRGSSCRSPSRGTTCCLLGPTAHRHAPLRLFRNSILQDQLDLLPLRLASFRAYASSIALPRYLQGSIPGPWLAVIGAGFTPARTTRHCQAATLGLGHEPRLAGHVLCAQGAGLAAGHPPATPAFKLNRRMRNRTSGGVGGRRA